uniref:Putative secreted protein n=1 Tax=Ixodes ricinus TaxID=34613 RepID=A0A6B0UDA5_IXORI
MSTSLFSCFLFGLLFLLRGILKIAARPLGPVHARNKKRVAQNFYRFTGLPFSAVVERSAQVLSSGFSCSLRTFAILFFLSNLSNYHSPVHTFHVTDGNPPRTDT